MNRTKIYINLSIVILAGLISLAFEWPWEQKAPAKPKSQPVQTAPQETKPAVKMAPASNPVKGEEKSTNEKESAGSATSGGEGAIKLAPVDPNEIQKIQDNITRLAEQTRIIQSQSQTDRANLQRIIDQANVQRQLLDSLKVPAPNIIKDAGNTEEILRATKLRLIADDVKRTQESLRSLQATSKMPNTATITPAIAKKVT